MIGSQMVVNSVPTSKHLRIRRIPYLQSSAPVCSRGDYPMSKARR